MMMMMMEALPHRSCRILMDNVVCQCWN